jgi:tetratricopeptide (TPR) repeat protein
MQTVNCNQCGRQFPINDTFKSRDAVFCIDCANKIASEQKQLPAGSFQRQADPTICVNCRKDYGSMPLPSMSGLPVCPQCRDFLKRLPFPNWAKIAFIAIIILIIFATFWNMCFMLACSQIQSSIKTFARQNFESKGIHDMPDFQQGISFLNQEKYAQALDAFNSCKNLSPAMAKDDILLKYLTSVAVAGVAFNNKDYDKFLAVAIDSFKENPENTIAAERVAAGYACKFAVTGDSQFKQQALDALEKAKKMPNHEGGFELYEQRIHHRLYTREIINGIEFNKRFPNGWTQPESQQNPKR